MLPPAHQHLLVSPPLNLIRQQYLQQVYQPVLIGAPVIDTHAFIGTDRGSHARPLVIKPWVVNDLHQALTACHYTARLSGGGHEFALTASTPFDVPADGVLAAAPSLVWDIPPTLPPGSYELTLDLIHAGQVISQNTYTLAFDTSPQ